MAACTSRAAASMSRSRSNCSVMLVDPRALDEVISVTAAMRPNCRSSGVATEEAMVSGLAPGKPALTEMVGKSTSRQRRHREQPVGRGAGQGNRDHQERGGDGLADEGLRNIHRLPCRNRFGAGRDLLVSGCRENRVASRSNQM